MAGPIPRPVRLLGWASLFTDAATEMIYPLLPVYLSRVLGASATSLGIIEGVAEGVNSLLKIASGWVSDRRRERRPIVILGYTLSSLARPLIAVSSSWLQVLAIRALDRTGKGIRGAPRDAMLAAHADAASRGRIFGFHRAMDHTGAVVGPIIATIFLAFFPGQYRLLFALTAIPGVLAVATLFRVEEKVGPVEHRERLEGSQQRLPNELYTVLGIIFLFTASSKSFASSTPFRITNWRYAMSNEQTEKIRENRLRRMARRRGTPSHAATARGMREERRFRARGVIESARRLTQPSSPAGAPSG